MLLLGRALCFTRNKILVIKAVETYRLYLFWGDGYFYYGISLRSDFKFRTHLVETGEFQSQIYELKNYMTRLSHQGDKPLSILALIDWLQASRFHVYSLKLTTALFHKAGKFSYTQNIQYHILNDGE
jgi:hypothetical protein